MKLNREKEYLAEKIYERVEELHNKDLRELLEELSNCKEINDIEDLTNEVKRINIKISVQCLLVELIMQEDWNLEEVKALDWLVTTKKDTFLKEMVDFVTNSKNPEDLKNKMKNILEILYKLGDITNEK